MASAVAPAASLGELGLYRDPHALLHRLRASDPVHYSDALGSWLLLRYDDVAAALRDDRFAPTGMARRIETSDDGGLEVLLVSVRQWVGRSSLADHKRLRTVMRGHFASRRTVAAVETYARALADRLAGELAARGGGEIVGDFAYPFTASVTAHAVGLPDGSADRLISWANQLRGVLQTGTDLATLRAAQAAVEAASAFMGDVVRARRARGHADDHDDLIGVLLRGLATGLVRDEEEIVANLVMMVAAGFDNTSNLISAGTWLLLEHPEALERLCADCALIAPAVEEMARLRPPVFVLTRVARTDIALRSKRIAEGDSVYICLAAANRDPAVFPDPDAFVIDRPEHHHVAFGAGPYACLAARMGRMQAQVAFERMLHHMPDLRLDAGHAWYEFRPLGCWLSALPVRCR
jgi:cytochrome P450